MDPVKYMTAEEIQAHQVEATPGVNYDPRDYIKQRLASVNQWSSKQQLGTRLSIGCVALEITQRCNLDCTCCYLSEHSEAVKDLPLEEIFKRIDMIHQHYGEGTSVQVTGGDPTLRDFSDLQSIIARLASKGLRPTLFTNGIRATRPYLRRLAEAGLADVAFHVDLTQERRGYKTEVELNRIRQQCIENARGLGIQVFFNFTVTENSFKEISDIVRYYNKNADVVKTFSFQLQADTGRGIDRERGPVISQDSVIAEINKGCGIDVNFDASQVGHKNCNRHSMLLVSNGNVYNALDASDFVGRIIRAEEGDKYSKSSPTMSFFRWLKDHPQEIVRGIKYFVGQSWNAKSDLIKSRGKVFCQHVLVHNFMDACHLEHERIKACSFFVMTQKGPISMCMMNAKRDDYILQPVEVMHEDKTLYWQPLSGMLSKNTGLSTDVDPRSHGLRHLKGRTRPVVYNEHKKEQEQRRAVSLNSPKKTEADVGANG